MSDIQILTGIIDILYQILHYHTYGVKLKVKDLHPISHTNDYTILTYIFRYWLKSIHMKYKYNTIKMIVPRYWNI